MGLLLALGQWCAAAPPPAAEKSTESGELRFRRVYFPEGMKDWPKGNVKYLPMEAGEFERLLEAIQRTAPGVPAQTSVGLVEAQYDARLKGESLLQGSATLNVSQSIAGAMLMTLDPCNLAIARAQWVTSDGAPAVLGITGDGKLQVLAERSGQMKFDWSLAGQRDAGGRRELCHRLAAESRESAADRDAGRVDADCRSWHRQRRGPHGPRFPPLDDWNWEAGPVAGCDWPRREAKKPGRQRSWPANRRTYDFSLRGVELSVKLNIEAHREPGERSRWASILLWNWSRSRRATCRWLGVSAGTARQVLAETGAPSTPGRGKQRSNSRRRCTRAPRSCGCGRLPRSRWPEHGNCRGSASRASSAGRARFASRSRRPCASNTWKPTDAGRSAWLP